VSARVAVTTVALVFAVWETTDIPHTGIAGVFAILFYACAALLWARSSVAAAAVVAFLCLVEATQAHTWKGVGPTAVVAAEILGSAGMVAAGALLVVSWRRRGALRRSLG
jgi:hypothetical protein